MSIADGHVRFRGAAGCAASALPGGDALAEPRPSWWLGLLGLVLLGYAMLGRGFAYLGVPPLFIGEVVIALGLASIALSRRAPLMPRMPLVAPLLLLMAWGAYRTVPYIAEFGMDALRDGVLWAYAVMALIVVLHLLANPSALGRLLARYRLFAVVFLAGTPFIWATRYVLGDAVPRWPWADVPVIEPKPGDVMVHLAGVLAFWVAGLGGRISWPMVALLGCCAAVIGAYERAGMFAFAGTFALCFVLRPRHPAVLRLGAMAAVSLAFLAATDIRLDVPVPDSPKVREVSFRQLVHNVRSVLGTTEMGDLDDTKHWRLEWWRSIIDYTVRGPWFWTGKGFGVNLADDDGFQVMPDHSLRSPHNGHITFLARAGVPGLLLWCLTQIWWAWEMLRVYIASTRAGRRTWAGVFLFLLAYWLAFMVNAAFDVFLEGPMGGLWFWTLYGAGLAAAWLYRRRPETLCDHAHTAGA